MTRAMSLALSVTSALMAFSTEIVEPALRPSLVGTAEAANLLHLHLVAELDLAGLELLEQHVERHHLGDRRRIAVLVRVALVEHLARLGVDHDARIGARHLRRLRRRRVRGRGRENRTAATMRHRVRREKLKTLWEANPGTPNKLGPSGPPWRLDSVALWRTPTATGPTLLPPSARHDPALGQNRGARLTIP